MEPLSVDSWLLTSDAVAQRRRCFGQRAGDRGSHQQLQRLWRAASEGRGQRRTTLSPGAEEDSRAAMQQRAAAMSQLTLCGTRMHSSPIRVKTAELSRKADLWLSSFMIVARGDEQRGGRAARAANADVRETWMSSEAAAAMADERGSNRATRRGATRENERGKGTGKSTRVEGRSKMREGQRRVEKSVGFVLFLKFACGFSCFPEIEIAWLRSGGKLYKRAASAMYECC
jgi:hypothetical protein